MPKFCMATFMQNLATKSVNDTKADVLFGENYSIWKVNMFFSSFHTHITFERPDHG